MTRRTLTLARAMLAAAGIAALLAGQPEARAQFNPDGALEGDATRVYLPMDRTATRGVQRAAQSIAKGEFSQAIRFLDEILGRDEDIFVELAGDAGIVGLKETARRLIRDLPAHGRRAYETAYGPVAERELQAAAFAGDAAAYAAVAQRYFYTPAGYEAALLSAMEDADAGRHHSAALTYQQLLDTPEAAALFNPQLSIRAAASWLAAGEADRSRRLLEDLVAAGRQATQIAGRERRLDGGVDALQWLRETVGEPADVGPTQERQWLTYRGNAARNGATGGGLPHMRVRWNIQFWWPPQLESLLQNLTADLIQSGDMAPVAGSPLAAGDYVLTRTMEGLLAVDFRSGKRVWRSEPERDPQLEELMRAGATAEQEGGNPELTRSFARRMWEDYLYGTMSSDGGRAYMIRGLALPTAHDFDMAPFMGGGGADETAPTNRLGAYELATQGKLLWEINGAAADGELAGAFFLGAPLAVGNSLYALAEIKGAGVYLAALDPATGRIQWRQQLANLEMGVLFDLRRRLQSATPSYEEGMLVCPTAAGVVVGIDLSKRSLAWAYRYETAPRPESVYRGRVEEIAGGGLHRWLDNAAVISDGRVLLTPPESPHLHCLDLRTGRLLWRQDRGQMLRLACVDQGRVLLVGNRKLIALRLEDGETAWARGSLTLPRDVSPSGAGFLSDGKYFLPLTSAEVVAIDMADGRIESRALARDGVPLGNLICHRGAVISQTGLSLDCFDQVEALKRQSEERLARSSADAEALRTLGEIAYNEGRLSEAISLLERAYDAAPDGLEARDVLAECLAAALDEDFAAYRSRLPLLKRLDDGSIGRRMLILRIEAKGLLVEGEPRASAAACLALYRLAGPEEELIPVGREHQASIARWVRAQLDAVWDAMDETEREAFAADLGREAAALGDKPSGDALSRFLEFFGKLPVAEPLRLSRARELTAGGQWLEAQDLLLDLAESDDEAVRAEAIARIDDALHTAGLHGLASEYDALLATELAAEPCLDGKTGLEVLAKWTEAAAQPSWPRGKAVVNLPPSGGSSASTRVRSPMWGVRLERTDSILGQTTGQFSTRNGELVLQDNLGREFFNCSIEHENQIPYQQPGSLYGASRGNLLVVSLGRQLVALNTLPAADGLSPPILWRANLSNNLEYAEESYGETAGDAGRPGSYRAPRTKIDGKWVGVIGPVTSEGCVYQDHRRLVCVDLLTGVVRWSRSDVPPGCDLFGDDDVLVAVPGGQTTATMYSIVDGRTLGKTKLPPWREQLATRGLDVICWKRAAGRAELSSLDARTGEVTWRHEFDEEAGVDVDQGRYVAVVELSGRVVVIDAADGRLLVDEQTTPVPKVDEVHLAVGQSDHLVVVKQPRPGNVERSVNPFNNVDSPVIDGKILLFDRQSGALRWNRPAEVIQQALLLTQPVDLPFLVFAGNLNTPRGSGSRAGATMLLVDKATGRTLFQSDELPQAGVGHCLARVTDAAKHEAAVEMPGVTIMVQFTDQRRPPEPPAMAEVESHAGKSSRGLMGIMMNLGGEK